MRDIHRVYRAQFIACLPFFIILLAVLATMVRVIVPISMEYLLLFFLSALWPIVVIRHFPILRHYTKALAKFEDNYRYAEEK